MTIPEIMEGQGNPVPPLGPPLCLAAAAHRELWDGGHQVGKGQRHVQEKGTKEGLLTGGWQLKGGRGWGATGSRNQEER